MIYINNYPLHTHSTIRLGGACEGYFPETECELIALIRTFEEDNIPYRIVGAMSNILPTDDKPKSNLVFCKRLCNVTYSGNKITLSCGVRLSRMIFRLAKEGKVLFPSLIGVPGLVGGMLVQNASCYDDEMASQFLSCRVYSITEKKIYRLTRKDMIFGYRTSILKKKPYILLDANFSVLDGDAIPRIHEVTQKRRKTMPEGPSLGSVFLRHNGMSIGYLLDKAGQKGRMFGDIAVSQRHAGVLINKGRGSARDYQGAVFHLSKIIEEHYGFKPICEIEFLS